MLLGKLFRKLFPRKRKPLRRGKYFCEIWFSDGSGWGSKTAVVSIDNDTTYPENLTTDFVKTFTPDEGKIYLDDAVIKAN